MISTTLKYKEHDIHFTLDIERRNTMVNATQVAEIFGKSEIDFLATEEIKFYAGNLYEFKSKEEIIKVLDNGDIYFTSFIAIKFACTISMGFEIFMMDATPALLKKEIGNFT